MTEVKAPFLRRFILRNYKSIKECDVSLGPLTLLVGPNGSGKSNFLDALRFVAESLQMSTGLAVHQQRDITRLCHCSREAEGQFAVKLSLMLPEGAEAEFGFVVVKNPQNDFEVLSESCRVRREGDPEAAYEIRQGRVESASFEPTPPASSRRLYLSVASAFPEFAQLHGFLSKMSFYNISPDQLREEGNIGRHHNTLMKDGEGVISVLRDISTRSRFTMDRIDEYMHAILPNLEKTQIESYSEMMARHGASSTEAPSEQLRDALFLGFTLRLNGALVDFSHRSMSDGTLRALGVLTALFQCLDRAPDDPIPVVGIEEPEAALHPAAAGVLLDALQEASYFTQVLVTTHSPDLLDTPSLDSESLLVVDMVDGATILGAADEASKSIMRDRLWTAGELLRQNQLRPEVRSPGSIAAEGKES